MYTVFYIYLLVCIADETVEGYVTAIKSKSRAVIRLGKQFFNQQLQLDISSAYRYETAYLIVYKCHHKHYIIFSDKLQKHIFY